MHKAALSRIERGERPYGQDFLEAAADALMCEPADLLIRNPLDPAAPWSIWERIPEPAKPQARAVLETFATPFDHTRDDLEQPEKKKRRS